MNVSRETEATAAPQLLPPSPATNDNQIISSADHDPQPGRGLDGNEFWPDQGLNRLLGLVGSCNTDAFDEVDCLEILFYCGSRRRDARRLAKEAINTYGSLAKVYGRPDWELRERLGLDRLETSLLAITKSNMRYILTPAPLDRQEVASPAALRDYLALDLREAEQETLRVLYLDRKGRIIEDEVMARGTVDAVQTHPREICRQALRYCASSLILAHNHLSDDPTPSRADIDTTSRVRSALQFIDVVLHDHIIIARRSCFSMRAQGIL